MCVTSDPSAAACPVLGVDSALAFRLCLGVCRWCTHCVIFCLGVCRFCACYIFCRDALNLNYKKIQIVIVQVFQLRWPKRIFIVYSYVVAFPIHALWRLRTHDTSRARAPVKDNCSSPCCLSTSCMPKLPVSLAQWLIPLWSGMHQGMAQVWMYCNYRLHVDLKPGA